MIRLPEFDPVKFLVRLKFLSFDPWARGFDMPQEQQAKCREEMAAYEAELERMSPAEIRGLVEQEKSKQADELKAKAEREEMARFFMRPNARADFDHWTKATYWTLDEAVALLFGKAPELVNWEKIKVYVNVSPFALQYSRVWDLARRASQWQQLSDPVSPGTILAWAKRNRIAVPQELETAVIAHGHQVVDWKTLYDQSQTELKATREAAKSEIEKSLAFAQTEAEKSIKVAKEEVEKIRQRAEAELNQKDYQIFGLTKERDDLSARVTEAEIQLSKTETAQRPLKTRERDSLLKLVIGLAIGGYKYDPSAKRNNAIADIANDLDTNGVHLDEDTIRKWLQEAAQQLPREIAALRDYTESR